MIYSSTEDDILVHLPLITAGPGREKYSELGQQPQKLSAANKKITEAAPFVGGTACLAALFVKENTWQSKTRHQ